MEFRGQSEQRSRRTIKENPRPLYATGSGPTRATSRRQLPTDHDYAVPTREYQTDQSSPKPAPAAAGPVFEEEQKQRQRQKQRHRFAAVDGVTPYQGTSAQVGDFSATTRVQFIP